MTMPTIVACPKCRASLKLAAGPSPASKKIRCPKCKDVFVPGAKKPAPAKSATVPTKANCPGCSTVLKVPANFPAGKKLKCPKCARTFEPGKKAIPAATGARTNGKPSLKQAGLAKSPAKAPPKSAPVKPVAPAAKRPAAKDKASPPAVSAKLKAAPPAPAKPKLPPSRLAPPPEPEPNFDDLDFETDLLKEEPQQQDLEHEVAPELERDLDHEHDVETNGRPMAAPPAPAKPKPAPAKKGAEADEYDEDEKKRQKRLLIIAIVLFVTSIGGYFLFFRGPSGPVRVPVYPVEGSVAYRGKPAVEAVITLIPEKQEKGQPYYAPRGEVGEDGSFKLTTYTLNDGAPAGKYKVTILWAPKSEAARVAAGLSRKAKADEEEKDVFDGKYANPDASTLTAEIKADTNKLEPFNLK
jgi:hypothetical protein